LELGQAIVRELELDARGNVLERWLAQHLAELMLVAEGASGNKKKEAERQAVDLILKLWSHRRALPSSVDPLGGYRDAIAVLSRLMPNTDPWRRYPHTHSYEGLLQEIFDTFSRAVVGGLLLTHLGHIRAFSDAELAYLEEEEIFLKTALEEWLEILRGQPAVKVKIVDPHVADDAEDQNDVSEEAFGEGAYEQLESQVHSAIATHIEHVRDKLGALLIRWRSAAPQTLERGEDPEGDWEEGD
jgi:hypothetical protein